MTEPRGLDPVNTPSPRRLLYVVGGNYAFLVNRLPMARAARKAGFGEMIPTHHGRSLSGLG